MPRGVVAEAAAPLAPFATSSSKRGKPSSFSSEVSGKLKAEWYLGSILVDIALHKCCTIWDQALKKELYSPGYKTYCHTNDIFSWYLCLHPAVRERVDLTGLGRTAQVVSPKLDTLVVHALADQWWPSTHTFHLPAREVTIIPLDFFMIIGIPFSRRPIFVNPSLETRSLKDIGNLLGFTLTSRVILLSTLKKEWDSSVIDDNSPRELLDQAARTSYDWGGSGYAHFLRMLDRVTFGTPGLTNCAYVLWCYEVLGIHAPGLPNESAPYIPRVTHWRKAGCSLIDELQVRLQLNDLAVNWYPGHRLIPGEYGLPPSHGCSVSSHPSHAAGADLPIA
ncbi:protein MAIN-LIKE 1-like [Telopea speciosissima]|uniref:protein MAIN-LIKE 1-like n=1 Tax=Telopea speciosissima TaxID=54955 RepID=UPI001CC665F7|nr:protein MAIN-LIKE 1-like [Telopea speciosissima]